MHQKAALTGLLLVVLSLNAQLAAGQASCSLWCAPHISCESACMLNGVLSNCGNYGVCTEDPDGDGLISPLDNCDNAYNPSQTDCDQDGAGDACDNENGNFVAQTNFSPCWVKSQNLVAVINQTRYAEALYRDTSACHSPDQWRKFTQSGTCFGFWWTSSSCCQSLWGVASCVYLNNNQCHP